MTRRNEDLTLGVGFDRSRVWDEGNSVRYLVAELTAPPAERVEQERQPLNLALVIDASGSMSGDRLECAKRAAIGVIERLGPDDVVSVVSFADDVVKHVNADSLTEQLRERAVEAIAQLSTRDCTNMEAGWLEGAECVARQIEESDFASGRVILLSDGLANRGNTDPRSLGEIADNLRTRGVFTSTVGIGDDYSPVQLEAIAEHGGGRLHDAETTDEIIEVVLAELGEVFATVADDVQLTLELPKGVQAESFGSYPQLRRGTELDISVGGMLGGARRTVVVKIQAPRGEVGRELLFKVGANWRWPGEEDRQLGPTYDLSLRFASGNENSAQPRDVRRSAIVAKQWQADLVRRAVQFNRDRDYRGAVEYLGDQLRFFERYCVGLPDTERLVGELHRVLRTIDSPWQERSRKEVQLAMYKGTRGEHDLRDHERPDWSDYVPD